MDKKKKIRMGIFAQRKEAALGIKAAFICVLVLFLAFVYIMNDANDVPMADIEGKLLKETDLGDMKKCNTRELLEFMGIDYSAYDEVIYYKSKVALDVSELMIVKANDKNDLNGVQDAVEKRISSQINTYRDYGPEQVSQLKNAVITKRGKYLFYCVAKDPEKYEGVFYRAV
ncbi:MAG: DUF4358 domain-containing protein [Eubacterium sp.]|nr:DUF4358 domain-containing protein [Eubacterium sp.]